MKLESKFDIYKGTQRYYKLILYQVSSKFEYIKIEMGFIKNLFVETEE